MRATEQTEQAGQAKVVLPPQTVDRPDPAKAAANRVLADTLGRFEEWKGSMSDFKPEAIDAFTRISSRMAQLTEAKVRAEIAQGPIHQIENVLVDMANQNADKQNWVAIMTKGYAELRRSVTVVHQTIDKEKGEDPSAKDISRNDYIDKQYPDTAGYQSHHLGASLSDGADMALADALLHKLGALNESQTLESRLSAPDVKTMVDRQLQLSLLSDTIPSVSFNLLARTDKTIDIYPRVENNATIRQIAKTPLGPSRLGPPLVPAA